MAKTIIAAAILPQAIRISSRIPAIAANAFSRLFMSIPSLSDTAA